MTILVFRTAFLEGGGDGIRFYIGTFEAERLADIQVWATACSQIVCFTGSSLWYCYHLFQLHETKGGRLPEAA
jgi:SNF family Na+-dependent transporter